MAEDWKRRSVLKSCAISRTRRWKLESVIESEGRIGIVRLVGMKWKLFEDKLKMSWVKEEEVGQRGSVEDLVREG